MHIFSVNVVHETKPHSQHISSMQGRLYPFTELKYALLSRPLTLRGRVAVVPKCFHFTIIPYSGISRSDLLHLCSLAL